MALKNLFGSRQKDIEKIAEESESLGEITVDCPAIIELKQDNELNKEINIQNDPEYYVRDDLLSFLKLSKTKITECKVKFKPVDNSKLHIVTPEGTIILHFTDLSFDWEI
jgi:hypothetical protein